jgi:hypothetical protein
MLPNVEMTLTPWIFFGQEKVFPICVCCGITMTGLEQPVEPVQPLVGVEI